MPKRTEPKPVEPQFYEPEIICGDNTRVMLGMEPNSVDLVVTSPPYDNLRLYTGYAFDFYGTAWLLTRLLKPGGVIVWVVADATINGGESGSSFRQALHFKELGLRLHDTMYWYKPNPMPLNLRRYEQAIEYMFVFSKCAASRWNVIKEPSLTAGAKNTGSQIDERGVRRPKWGNGVVVNDTRVLHNVWEYGVGSTDGLHPAIFPEKLAADHIQSWSNPGDLVLDPFVGSGTTCRAAYKLGRRSIGIDVSPKYCELARKCINAITNAKG